MPVSRADRPRGAAHPARTAARTPPGGDTHRPGRRRQDPPGDRGRRPAADSQSCYVDFSPIDDPGLVAPTVAAAAGVAITPGDDPVAAIAETLASRERARRCWTPVSTSSTAAAQVASAVLHAAPGCAGAGHEPAPARRVGRVRLAGATAGPAAAGRRWRRRDHRRTPPVALFIERAHRGRARSRRRRRRRRRHRRRVHRARRPAAGHRAGRRPHRRAQPGGDPYCDSRTASGCSSTAAADVAQRQQTLASRHRLELRAAVG